MSKRYTTSTHEFYDSRFMQLKNSSDILTGGKEWNIHSKLYNKKGLQVAIIERIGNQEDGDFKDHYLKNGYKYQALIPLHKENIADLEVRFLGLQEQQELQGLEPLAEMPAKMLEKKLEYEALIDVAEEEVKKLQKTLKEFVDEKEEEENKVLKFGMLQMSKLSRVDGKTYGQVSMIDYQRVGRINGTLCIKDLRSQYNGMSVLDYRKLAKVWRKNKDEDNAKRFLAIQKKCKANFETPPDSYMPGLISDPKLLPDWPKGVKNHYNRIKEEDDSSSAGMVQRTK